MLHGCNTVVTQCNVNVTRMYRFTVLTNVGLSAKMEARNERRISMKTRKVISTILGAVFGLTLLSGCYKVAETPKKPLPEFEYELINDGTEYALVKYNGVKADIVMPSTFDGKPVTKISRGAFKQNWSYKSVVVGSEVKTIEKSAFSSCAHLAKIVLPDSLETIEDQAFALLGLTEIVIPDSVKTIGENAFLSCNHVATVWIGKGVSSIGSSFLAESAHIMSIDVDPENPAFETIDGSLYSKGGTTLVRYATGREVADIVIPETVTAIYPSAFSWATLIETVVLPEGLRAIEDHAFFHSGILRLDVPELVTSIGDYAFAWSRLESITLHGGRAIGAYAFRGTKVEGTNI